MSRRIDPESRELKYQPISDDFLFSEVMRTKELCKPFLEQLLGREIAYIQESTKEKVIDDKRTAHGVRLDVYFKDDANTLYNLEMQTTKRDSLEKRARYYQSAMDRDSLPRNTLYKKLVDSYIIFICTFDYYKCGYAVYRKKSVIAEAENLPYNDGSHVYFLNAMYEEENAGADVLTFLDYVRTNDESLASKSELVAQIIAKADAVRDDTEKGVEYMTWRIKMDEIQAEALEKGLEQGREEGIIKGLAVGVKALMDAGDDFIQACKKMNIAEVRWPQVKEEVALLA